MTDTEIISLLNTDPHEGHRSIIKEYGRYVYTIVYNKLRSCGTEEDVEECISDIFADVFIALDKNNTDKLKPLISTIAKRTAIDHYRSLSVKTGRTTSIDNESMGELASDFNVEHISDTNELRRILLEKIELLGEPDSTILIQKFYYNRKSAEIAEAVSMNASSVRARSTRALQKLKQLLTDAVITR